MDMCQERLKHAKENGIEDFYMLTLDQVCARLRFRVSLGFQGLG